MLDGKCPRCDSESVYVADSGVGIQRDATFNLRTGSGMFSGTLPIKFKDYVCTNCGFFEMFNNDRTILEKIYDLAQSGEQWEKAGR